MEKSMEQIQHFIWDFDGTLVDTYPVIIADLRSALQEYGYDCDPVETMGLMLVNIIHAAEHYARKFGLDAEELMNAYRKHHNLTVSQFSAEPMAGVAAVLAKICDSGRHNYIFTHRKNWETVAYLEKYGLDRYFRDIVGSESPCFARKPAPDGVLYLMEKYGMQPENTVMVGDRDCDLGSGRNAGVKTAHLLCPAVPEMLDCTWRLQDFDEMLTLL